MPEENTNSLFAFGLGHATRSKANIILDSWFPAPLINLNAALSGAIKDVADLGVSEIDSAKTRAIAQILEEAGHAEAANLSRALSDTGKPNTCVALQSDAPITSTPEAYLKLHLLSHRLCLPNTLNLDGIFAHLPTVAWTNKGPMDPADVPAAIIEARTSGTALHVRSLDKFPQMADYVLPAGVRIANSARVRLGAFVGDGTTVMHEGQINFNSGAVGPNMVEGRISQGVILGANTDLGGGASTMGTLSGGGTERVSLGENCLVGANGGTGIPLGDRCTIEAGLYITAGTVVRLLDADGDSRQIKARELAGASDLLFIRHSATGEVQCRTNQSAIELNDALHAHN